MLKNLFIKSTFYTIAASTTYLIIFYIILNNRELNLISIAILCGILNFYLINHIVNLKNNEIKESSYRQRESYISTLTHDLKIPTLAQINALKLLSNEKIGKINKKQKEIVNLTLESCDHMYSMLSTILSTYKYENKDISLFYEKINIIKIIEQCFDKSADSLKCKNLNVKINTKENILVIFADKSEMYKAFDNIIKHCIASAYENSQIVCEIINKNNKIYLSLSFESPYLSAKSLQNMLKKYTTSAEKMDKIGSSLNLYLAKQIISAHKGTLYINSPKPDLNIYKIEIPGINDCKFLPLTCHT